MFYTEKEIMTQHIALQQTCEYFETKTEEIERFFKAGKRKFVFLGCGSSYMLAKSGQRLFNECENTAAIAVAGGDYLTHKTAYENFVKDSIVICLSRSGKTSEIVRSVCYIKSKYGCPVISVSMEKENELFPYSELNLVMEWAYDKSVCQTRTVTNLYLALLLLKSCYEKDSSLKEDIKGIVKENKVYKEKWRPQLKEIAEKGWKKAVILADASVCGIAEEGALAFTEISRTPGYYASVLDYRHGPMVLNDNETLNIVFTDSDEYELIGKMIKDLKMRGGIVITASSEEENRYESNFHIKLGDARFLATLGIPFIYIMQMIAYERAIKKGCNPDKPEGLDAYITL